jgi:hypothetical protein
VPARAVLIERETIRRPACLAAAAGLALATAVRAGAGQPSSALGVNVHFAGQAHTQGAEMAAAGISWVRTDLAWSHAERQSGSYDFEPWERLVTALEPHGIRTLLILDYGNALHEGGFPPRSEAGRRAFAAFAGAAARHFRGRAAWEIWNEPNVPRYWAGAPDAGAYVALARSTAAAIRREDPGAWILGPGLGGGRFDLAYLESTFGLGLLEVVDAVSVHPYGAASPEAALPFYADVRRLMTRHLGRELPIVVSEWGYRAEDLGPEGQARTLLRALSVNQDAGIRLTVWYNWQDPIVPWDSFGLLDAAGRSKPAYEALRALQAQRR